jgi:hypothetical protein
LAQDVDVFVCKARDENLWALLPFSVVAGRQTIALPEDSWFWNNWSVFDDSSGPEPAK